MQVENGFLFPFGASISSDGINFSVYAKDADHIRLCLFQESDLTNAFEKIDLHKTGDIWHIRIKELPYKSIVYNYEVTKKDQTQLLLDPYAKNIASEPKWQEESRKNFTYRPFGKVVQHDFNWEGDVSPGIAKKDLIIYEMHLRGFTNHRSSQVSSPGTFKGMMEKIPHLLELGINAVELMPIHEFCEEDVIHENPENHKKLHNYFGYSTINFFSLMNRYASESQEDNTILEFKSLVKELHKNKIEVILDVVFNHTLEGNQQGQVLSFKGLDNKAYYIMNNEDQYMNFSGCGNTFNCNHPITMELIIQALRYWVLEYHIDGFRFDLASVFNRGTDGAPLEKAPLMEFISADPVLSACKLIAEPWDAGGLYEVGKFASLSPRWSEWNGKYRDTVRNFIKGTAEQRGPFSGALSGFGLLYPNSPFSSVNFVVCHDGFNLADLVSYNDKHNLANGEENKDGNNQNDSWNCGVEGSTTKKQVLNLRQKQMRNFHLALMLSQGIPMILMGDEYAHTRQGNNNAWCQDNELNWFLWDRLKDNHGFYRFYRALINFRKNHPLLHIENHWTEKEVQWHGLNPNQPEWENDNRIVALSLHYPSGEPGLYAAFNASNSNQTIVFPNPGDGKSWQWIVNTKNNAPDDFFDESKRVKLMENTYQMAPYSSLLLQAFNPNCSLEPQRAF